MKNRIINFFFKRRSSSTTRRFREKRCAYDGDSVAYGTICFSRGPFESWRNNDRFVRFDTTFARTNRAVARAAGVVGTLVLAKLCVSRSDLRSKCFAAALIAVAVVSQAFAEDAAIETNKVPWSVQRMQRELCGDDVWEPFNRSMFWVFDGLMEYVADPFCYVYSSVIPKPLIKGIDNFSENLEYPVRLVSNLCMAEWELSWKATERFAINSTVGICGLFDPAGEWWGILDSDSSLSDAFACWGIPSGPPLALPFMPRSSLRGHIGYVLDYCLDPKTWFDFIVPSGIFIGYSWCLVPNKAPIWRGSWDELFYHAEDGYSIFMPAMAAVGDFNIKQDFAHHCLDINERICLTRDAKQLPEGSPERAELEAKASALCEDVRAPIHPSAVRPDWLKGEWRDIPGYSPRSPVLDSIRALCFTPLGDDDFWWERRSVFNRDFSKTIEVRKLEIDRELPAAKYSYVAREKREGEASPDRLVIVLPGIGAGQTATEAIAMAELLHQNDFAVVICDSLFHWEHVQSVNRGILPGKFDQDVRRYSEYLKMIVDDLTKSGKLDEPEVNVVGWSMGALTAIHMAAMDDAGKMPLEVKRFVALNTPASLEHAVKPFDKILQQSCTWTRERAKTMISHVSCSLYGWAHLDHPRYDPANPPKGFNDEPWDYAPNLSDDEASYLLWQTFRIPLTILVAQRHRIAPFPWIKSEFTWFHRRKFYEEIGEVQIREYFEKYLPTCYEGTDTSGVLSYIELRSLEKAIRHNEKLVAIHSWNDLILTDDDRKFIDETLGKRITWFADGGHCGYFYTKPFQEELLKKLSR